MKKLFSPKKDKVVVIDKYRSLGDKVFDLVTFVILSAIFIIVAYPLYFILISSISDPQAVSAGDVRFVPIRINFEGYMEVFKTGTVMRGFMNSVFYTVMTVIVSLTITLPTAYALSRKDFYGRKPITIFYLITMFVSGGLVPSYLVVKNLGLTNTMWALIIPGSLSVFNLLVCRTFFVSNIPQELLEAAKIDGCGNAKFFFKIVLPLSGAIIAIMVLYYGVAQWNSYFSALIYITDRGKWPLQMELRNILIQNSMINNMSNQSALTPEAIAEKNRLSALMEMMKYSLIIISSLPIIILYPFVQKYFVKGVTIGSVKG